MHEYIHTHTHTIHTYYTQGQLHAATRDKKLLAANVSVLRYALSLQPVAAVATLHGDAAAPAIAVKRLDLALDAERRGKEVGWEGGVGVV